MTRIGRLDVHLSGDHHARFLALAGRIDDTALLISLAEHVTADLVAIDTGDVVFVNSPGIREWIRFLRALSASGARIRLVRVADVLVTQLNLIPDVATGAEVASVMAPYACDKCGAEASQLVDVTANRSALLALQTPTFACSECGTQMVLDDFPDRYFAFVRR
jgi:hypothetical protein